MPSADRREQMSVDRRLGLNTAAVVSGYQGSPLGRTAEVVEAAAVPDLGIVVRPAIAKSSGPRRSLARLVAFRPEAARDGVVRLWYGKGPRG